MSFNRQKFIIEEGDTIILYLTINKIYALDVVPQITSKKGILVENVFQVTPYGALKVRDLIGKKYGSKVNLSAGWGYILQPTPELWTLTLPHRTQIIYTPDISMIIMQLDIMPGSVVIESGTGSGSLSHALIRAIKPHGHLYTFDFHEQRCNTAKEEFQNHGIEEFVTVQHRDVCENGFSLENIADAVFLDLPLPWLAIPHAKSSLKETGGRICTFSPCIEQVQKSCEVLSNLNFIDIQTMEVLQTQYSVQTRSLPVVKLDYLKIPKSEDENNEKQEKQEKEICKVLTAIPPQSLPGHTGYLTFATLLPIWARKQTENN